TPQNAFAVYDPVVKPDAFTPTNASVVPDTQNQVVILALAPVIVNVGDHILVSVKGIGLLSSPEVPPDNLTIGTVVQSELRILNCVATAGLAVIYFSENLNNTPPTDPTSPNNPSNYSVSIAGGQTVQPSQARYDDTIQATFLQFAQDQ